ncbi:hypothetical protein ACRN98_23540 [Shewanella oncorhynchi]|uniref:hypothetical protein n=1 Tax=Shewanella TaxID=22 RepID=UPI0021D7F29E|nr:MULTISPECIES: hypothetical protein [unclassified Shewanella]MCU7965170.1 hypothetical protein [Shewanella sp. SW32]MCU7973160.1 hypothetical protein [Shewanella sp. SW29]MCU8036929.1 hypothetical protein [Shewanella sp. SM69]
MSRYLLVLVLSTFSHILIADEWASSVTTPGYGRIDIISDYLLFSTGKSYDVKIPNIIQEGSRIKIQYKNGEQWVSIDFVVAGISTKGDLCRLHSKLPSRYTNSASDTIYVKQCRYK